MTGSAPAPMTADAANRWLRDRVAVPTDMTAAQLAISPDFDARAKVHSLFSARVSAANVLDDIRAELLDYAGGAADLATARWNLKTALASRGYAADDVGMADTPPAGMDTDEWRRRREITNLASTARINLILQQNARMAWAVGRREVSEHPAVRERWPNYRYIARMDGRERPEHAALHGLVLSKDDPFWATHTPPWDYNCRCDIEDTDADPAGAAAVTTENPDGSQSARVVNPATGTAREILPPESGFVFRADEAFASYDMSRLRNLDMRRATHAAMIREAAATGTGLTLRGVGSMAKGELGVRPPDNVRDIRLAFAKVSDAVKNGRELPEVRVSLGRLLPAHADALGIDPAETSVWMTSPGSRHKHGAAQWRQHHADDMQPDRAVNLLERTLWNESSEMWETAGSQGRRLMFREDGGSAVASLVKQGEGWEFNIVSSWEATDEYLAAKNRTMSRKKPSGQRN